MSILREIDKRYEQMEKPWDDTDYFAILRADLTSEEQALWSEECALYCQLTIDGLPLVEIYETIEREFKSRDPYIA